MRQIPLTKGKFALVDDEDYEHLMQWKWCLGGLGYAIRHKHIGMINGKQKQRAIWMHREIAKTPSHLKTDHINGDKLDNRKSNLRVCTVGQNAANKKSNKNSSSKYKGVFWQKRDKAWKASITVNGKVIYLGYFRREEDAALAYNLAAAEHFGEFALFNKAA